MVTPSDRTADQTYIGWRRQSNPSRAGTTSPANSSHETISTLLRAPVLAMQNLAAADAAINDWNDKYHFSFWRLFQAIRRAADDGNPATSPDPTGFAARGALPRSRVGASRARRFAHHRAAGVLRQRTCGGYQITSFAANTAAGLRRVRSAASRRRSTSSSKPASMGLHFRTADVQGAELGTNIANFAMENYLRWLD